MADPQTINKLLSTPTRGSYSGTWDQPVNNNSIAVDGMFGGFTNIALAAATTFALTTPSGSVSPGAGPTQSQNALIRFSGTLTGNVVVQFTLPGFYIVENLCSGTNSFYVQLAPNAGTGNAIGAIPGEKCHVFFDGTSMDYVDLGRVGSALDLHGVTDFPKWMTACTVLPYLIKNGAVFNIASYTALGALLGATFGGNGVTTFAVPDERARARIAFDPNGTGRVTAPVNAQVMGAAGGSQSLSSLSQLPQFTPSGSIGGSYTTPNTYIGDTGSQFLQQGGSGWTNSRITIPGSSFSFTGNAVGTTNPAQALQPVIVSFLPLIKT